MCARSFIVSLILACFYAFQNPSAHTICGHCPGDSQPSSSSSSASSAPSSSKEPSAATVPTTQSTAGLDSPIQRSSDHPLGPVSTKDMQNPADINKALDKAFYDGFYFDKPADNATSAASGQNKPLQQSQVQVGGPIQVDHVVNKKPPADKVIPNTDDQSMFKGYVDTVFSGETSDMVQLRYTWTASIKDGESKKDVYKGVNKTAVPVDIHPGSPPGTQGNQGIPPGEKSGASGSAQKK